jgi:HPt (histidine-containing phosphotransfer) domain-containing protein
MIDWHQVNELREDMGDGFDEIVDVFLHEVEDAMSRLDPAMGDGPMAADLHFLKGAALNLGFESFASLCADGEEQASKGDGASVDIAAIRSCYTASRNTFIEGLARDAA